MQNYLQATENIFYSNLQQFNSILLNQTKSFNEELLKTPSEFSSHKSEIFIDILRGNDFSEIDNIGYLITSWLKIYYRHHLFLAFDTKKQLHISMLINGYNANDYMKKQTIWIQRHNTLIYLYNKLFLILSEGEFKDRKSLIKLFAKKDMMDLLKKFHKIYHVLFCYYRLNDSQFVSYLENEHKQRYIFIKDENTGFFKEAKMFNNVLPENAKIYCHGFDIELATFEASS